MAFYRIFYVEKQPLGVYELPTWALCYRHKGGQRLFLCGKKGRGIIQLPTERINRHFSKLACCHPGTEDPEV